MRKTYQAHSDYNFVKGAARRSKVQEKKDGGLTSEEEEEEEFGEGSDEGY